MNRVVPSNIKSIFPKQVPKDIITLVDGYLHEDIRIGARKLYNDTVKSIISSILVPESYFVEKFLEYFIEKVGQSFEDFLSKYEKSIDGVSVETSPGLKIINEVLSSSCPKNYTGCPRVRTFILKGTKRGVQTFSGDSFMIEFCKYLF